MPTWIATVVFLYTTTSTHIEAVNFLDRVRRDRTDDLVRNAESGKLAVVAKHGHPLFGAVPHDDELLREGAHTALAIKLFQDGTPGLGKAAKLAGQVHEAFVEHSTSIGVWVVDFSPAELDTEVAAIG